MLHIKTEKRGKVAPNKSSFSELKENEQEGKIKSL